MAKPLTRCIQATVTLTERGARSTAAGWRQQLNHKRTRIRVYQRNIRAGGRKLAVWVVIADERPAKAVQP